MKFLKAYHSLIHNQVASTTEAVQYIAKQRWTKRGARDMEPRDLCIIKDIKEKQNLPLKGIICEFSGKYRWGTTSLVCGKS